MKFWNLKRNRTSNPETDHGATLVGYAMLVMVVSLGGVTVLGAVGQAASDPFEQIAGIGSADEVDGQNNDVDDQFQPKLALASSGGQGTADEDGQNADNDGENGDDDAQNADDGDSGQDTEVTENTSDGSNGDGQNGDGQNADNGSVDGQNGDNGNADGNNGDGNNGDGDNG